MSLKKLICSLVFLTTLTMSNSEDLNEILNNEEFVRKQIDCVMDSGSCDLIGFQIKSKDNIKNWKYFYTKNNCFYLNENLKNAFWYLLYWKFCCHIIDNYIFLIVFNHYTLWNVDFIWNIERYLYTEWKMNLLHFYKSRIINIWYYQWPCNLCLFFER